MNERAAQRTALFRISKWAAAVCVFLAVLYVALVWSAIRQARQTRIRAESLLQASRTLRPGSATREQVLILAERFGARVRSPDPKVSSIISDPASVGMDPTYLDPCAIGGEAFVFEYDHPMLTRLGLASYEAFSVTLMTYRDVVCLNRVGFESRDKAFALAVEERLSGADGWFHARVSRSWTSIDITRGVPEDVREGAYDFKLDCMGRLGGCKSSSEVLPWIWANLKRRGVYYTDP